MPWESRNILLKRTIEMRFALQTCQLYLKASPLPPAPLAVAGFMVAGLVAWHYYDRLAGLLGFTVWFCFASTLCWSVCWLVGFWMWWLGNILIGLLACWVLLSGFCFASTLCWSVCWLVGFWMLVPMPLFWYLQLPRYSP